MLRMIVHLLGGTEVPTRKADILMSLEQILDSNFRDGRKTVIVIDEAHAIEQSSLFEEIRLLLNYQAEGQFLLTLLILGQPELKAKVEANKQLNQRIAVRYHLQGLSVEDTANYILHRMLIAGSKRPVFDEGTLGLIHERSAGIPRRINQICDFALLTGMNRQAEKITAEVVREAIDSLEK
jgi:type II secretory pathway predicted ATPase ExeA